MARQMKLILRALAPALNEFSFHFAQWIFFVASTNDHVSSFSSFGTNTTHEDDDNDDDKNLLCASQNKST
jgi:hypothetical protein